MKAIDGSSDCIYTDDSALNGETAAAQIFTTILLFNALQMSLLNFLENFIMFSD